MANYEYPKEVTDENFDALFQRAKVIRDRTYNLDLLSVFVTLAIFFGFLTPIFWYYHGFFHSLTAPWTLLTVILVFIGGSLFISTFLNEVVRAFLRRCNFLIFHYPTSEECIFAEIFIIANRIKDNRVFAKNWQGRFRSATFRVKLLCDEFSLFSNDFFNVKRRFYAPEFNLLASGENQISRMLIFSKSKTSKMLTDFALALVRNEDVIAFQHVKTIIRETNKFGKLENLSKRIGNQLRSVYGILALVGVVIASIAGIITIISALT